MRISQINFVQNNIKSYKSPVLNYNHNLLLFRANSSDGFRYSLSEKENEVRLIRIALNEAIKNYESVDAEKLSKKTGLDIYTVKLRLFANDEIRILYNKLKVVLLLKSREEKENLAKNVREFFELLKKKGKKLTDCEIAYYLGIGKSRLSEIINDFPSIAALYGEISFKTKDYPLAQKKTQTKNVTSVLKYSPSNITLAIISDKTGYDKDTLRGVLNANDELFTLALERKIYPPELYSEAEIENQERIILNLLLHAIKYNKQIDISTISSKTGILESVIQMRLSADSVLDDAYKRASGMYSDED